MSKIKSAFDHQKTSAKHRGIAFEFDFEDWVHWWEEQLGYNWFKKRGCKRGQYVMGRLEDKGPYARGNVKCILSEDNHAEFNSARGYSCKLRRCNLPKEVVIAIFKDEGGPTFLSKKYGVTKNQVYCIKTKRQFSRHTNGLG